MTNSRLLRNEAQRTAHDTNLLRTLLEEERESLGLAEYPDFKSLLEGLCAEASRIPQTLYRSYSHYAKVIENYLSQIETASGGVDAYLNSYFFAASLVAPLAQKAHLDPAMLRSAAFTEAFQTETTGLYKRSCG